MRSSLFFLRSFLLPFAVWVVVGAGVIILSDQEELHVAINQLNHPMLDVLFKYGTHLGDGLFGAFIVLLGFIYKLRYGLIGLLGLAGSGGLTQVLKRLVFGDHVRPSLALQHMGDLHFVEGITLHAHHSFPSGHATAAFATFLFLALIAKNQSLAFICFLIGLLVAFSRVYISQHFFEDIYVGSIIGTSVTFLAIYLLHAKTWGEKGAVALIHRS
ncbi:MAG: phosphatase PAP2 family protein [Cryomorphaceae bacterium]